MVLFGRDSRREIVEVLISGEVGGFGYVLYCLKLAWILKLLMLIMPMSRVRRL